MGGLKEGVGMGNRSSNYPVPQSPLARIDSRALAGYFHSGERV